MKRQLFTKTIILGLISMMIGCTAPKASSFEIGDQQFLLDGESFLSKGLVWINGYAIGRFWEIGPQQTLFVPGCWLKKGQNEIIVLDLEGPEKAVISGITTPILDLLRSDEEILERKKNNNPDESGYF